MAEFTWSPDYGLSVETKQHVMRLPFGDGYDLVSTSMINNSVRTFNPTFTLSESAIDEIEGFLDTYGDVDYFTWTPPDGIPGKFICKDGTWDRTVINYSQHKLTATFIEVFEL